MGNLLYYVPAYDLEQVATKYTPDVNVWEVQRSAEELYKAVKIVGVGNTVTQSHGKGLQVLEKKGPEEISRRVRAMAGYLTMNRYHMSDSHNSIERLETHLGGISFESTLGYMLDKMELVPTWSTYDILKKYVKESNIPLDETPVPVNQLYKVIELRKSDIISLWQLWLEIELLFKSIVTVGVENTVIWYYDHNRKRVEKKGRSIPERMRAFCGHAVIHMYRMNDDDAHKKFMQERMKLSSSIEIILGDTNIFMDEVDKRKCVPLREFVARYLLKDSIDILLNSPVCIQELYELVYLNRYKPDAESLANLWTSIDTLYKTIKILGFEDTIVWYKDTRQKKHILKGNDIPERIRAFCEEVVIYMYRMNDETESRRRLEEHLRLTNPSRHVLWDTKLFKDTRTSSMPCICLLEMEKRYLNM